jgi:hypothetical protein
MTYRDDGRALRLERQANARLFDVIDHLHPILLTCHILVDTPGQLTELYTVLVDGGQVLRFELPKSVGSTPENVEFFSADQFREEVGQGKFRLMLDRAIEDYRQVFADAR